MTEKENPTYAVQRCNKSDMLFGMIHGSDDCLHTICGISINESWWIISNDSSRTPTCKKCVSTAQTE